MLKPYNREEILALVDDNDKVIGTVARGAGTRRHLDGKLHRAAVVLIANGNDKILLQKRAGNGLDFSVGGHFAYNEDYLDGAVRETGEELGVTVPREEFTRIAKFRADLITEGLEVHHFMTLFEVRKNFKIEDFKIDKGEVDWVRYYTIDEIKDVIKGDPLHSPPGFHKGLEIYLSARGFL
ncbi:MAG: NUDIX domain-containing protein [Candidatus Micrarchaeota archaeon]|nr:NUDIX domain-containing protein [Candidatus Micrarchaeota archaeon]